MKRGMASEESAESWRKLRDRWEYSHVLRAILSASALVALITAVAR
jgi:hypothetical protein